MNSDLTHIKRLNCVFFWKHKKYTQEERNTSIIMCWFLFVLHALYVAGTSITLCCSQRDSTVCPAPVISDFTPASLQIHPDPCSDSCVHFCSETDSTGHCVAEIVHILVHCSAMSKVQYTFTNRNRIGCYCWVKVIWIKTDNYSTRFPF